MDRLARNAMLAKQAGLSYGQWKAMQPIVPVAEVPDDWRKCPECGTKFEPKGRKKYCNYECLARASKRIRKDWVKRKCLNGQA